MTRGTAGWTEWEPRLRAARATNRGRLPMPLADQAAAEIGVSSRTIHRWLERPPQMRRSRRFELSAADHAAIAAAPHVHTAWAARYPDGPVNYVTFWRAWQRSVQQGRKAPRA